jgi:membrane-bound metal-dependent hydrolase YbcI (DUF457 family)
LSLFVVLLIVLTFLIRYYKNEWKILFIGIVLSLFFEIGGDLIYKAQFWENASFFGIPLWLPLLWGYGFIIIRRVGNFIIIQKS